MEGEERKQRSLEKFSYKGGDGGSSQKGSIVEDNFWFCWFLNTEDNHLNANRKEPAKEKLNLRDRV